MDAGTQLAHSEDIGIKIGLIFQKRAEKAVNQAAGRVRAAVGGEDARHKLPGLFTAAANPWSVVEYMADAAQRSVLFWDTMRRRGNEFIDNVVRGQPPQLPL